MLRQGFAADRILALGFWNFFGGWMLGIGAYLGVHVLSAVSLKNVGLAGFEPTTS